MMRQERATVAQGRSEGSCGGGRGQSIGNLKLSKLSKADLGEEKML